MTEEQYQQIERYVSGQLSEQEKEALEQQLQNDPELQKALNEHKQAAQAVRAAAFEEQKSRIRQLDQQRGGQNWKRMLQIAAAAAVLLIPLSYFLWRSPATSQLAMEYLEPYPDRITVMGSEQSLNEAMQAYNTKDYETALSLLKRIETADRTPLLELYQAICLLELEKCEPAQELLNPLANSEESVQEAANWYRILALVQCEQEAEASEALQALLGNENQRYNRSKAAELLDQLSE